MKKTTMDDDQFLDSFKKKRIQLTLKNATYAGIVQRINLNKTVLLEDVVDLKNGRKLPGVKLFFGYEILNVEFPNATKNEHGNNADCGDRMEGQLTVAEFQPYRKNIKLGDDEEDDSEYVDFVVIDEFHEKFGPAVMQIRKQQVIGIGADGVGVSLHERLCWLQIATKTTVYLFDILLLGARAFKNGLSMILESNQVLKVAHDCRGIAGCLWTQYGVNLSNVFDTQVADVMHFYTETGGFLPERVSTLQEVVGLHLNVPPTCLASLKIKSQLSEEDRDVWYVRPCPVSLLKVMALSVIHLQPLRLVLLDALMSDYTDRVDAFLSSSRVEPVNTRPIGTSSGLELPVELLELESLRQERREAAVGKYPMTKDGLLVRSSPRPAPPTEEPSEDTPTWSQSHRFPPTEAKEAAAPIRLLASAEGPSDVTPLKSSLNLPPPCVHRAGSLGETQNPKQATSEETPAATGPGAPKITPQGSEKVIGRGQQLQMLGVPALTTCPPTGRGLCLQISPHVSRELPGAGKPQPVGRVADISPGPAPAFSEIPVVCTGGARRALTQREALIKGAVPSGTMPENLISLGRGLLFQRPPSASPQVNLSFSSFGKPCQ